MTTARLPVGFVRDRVSCAFAVTDRPSKTVAKNFRNLRLSTRNLANPQSKVTTGPFYESIASGDHSQKTSAFIQNVDGTI